MILMARYVFIVLISVSACVFSEAWGQQKLMLIDSTNYSINGNINLNKLSFRGLSVVNNKVIWASGTQGVVAKSTNGGKSFVLNQIQGYEHSDFRDIEAFDDKHAVIMSSGFPALILVTQDGGNTWKETFRKNDSVYFLDAMDFWNNKNGIVIGDPVEGYFYTITTHDGGLTWQVLDKNKCKPANNNEAIFAASGTSLRAWGKKSWGFVYGADSLKGHLCVMQDEFNSMKKNPCPSLDIQYGSKSQGPFSFARFKHGFVVVGGNYLQHNDTNLTSEFILNINYPEWQYQQNYCSGYRSCVEAVNNKLLIACGTNGVDVFENGLWKKISNQSLHVVKKAKRGNAVFAAGAKGVIAKIIVKNAF